MNHAYRLVWSAVQHRYIPAPETAKGHGRSSGRSAIVASLCAALLGSSAWASPIGGTVSAGSGSIAQSGANTTITQNSQNLAINWASFGTTSGERVNFVQPNSSAIALNRVTGSESSVLNGSLNANGQVWILNPNGVLFGSTASVNVGGLVASTLSLSDADFLAGKRSFSGDGTQGSIVNQGSLTGGYVALLGKQVRNSGSITTANGMGNGMVALAAGDKITLDFSGNQLLSVQIDEGTFNALVENKGLVRADNGTVVLTASAKDALLGTVVNNEGVIEAKGIDASGGTILLLGGFNGGTVKVGGTLDASSANHNGGFIETSGAHVQVADGAKISTLSDSGKTGTWLIDPTDFTISSGSGSQTTSGMGATTLSNNLASNNISLTTDNSTGTDSGDINVNAAVSWSANTTLTLNAYNNINVNAAITATGASAGLALNYGGDYKVAAPVTLSGASATLALNGTAYTLIHSMAQLDALDGASGHYALAEDLDASGTTYADAVMAGTFSGTFAGLGHTISNLAISASSTNYVGLFAQNSGSIRDLGVVGGSVVGNSYVGALVGFNSGSISDAYATGTVAGNSNYIGGLVGWNNTGTISNVYATGSVSGTGNTIGGLVGWNNGSISNAYATGSVTGASYFNGGLVGYNAGSISSAYATGSVTGASYYTGGLVGDNIGSTSNAYASGNVSGASDAVGGLAGGNRGSISDAYATGSVFGGGDNIGGLVGFNSGSIRNAYATGSVSGSDNYGGLVGNNTGSISNAYWDSTTTHIAAGIGSETGFTSNVSAVTSSTATNHSSYTYLGTWTETASGSGVWVARDGSSNKLWVMVEGSTRPFLYSEYSTSIHNAHQLQLMAYDLAASYTLSANVDASETSGSNASGMWTPSGFSPVGNGTLAFSGSLDGQSHTIADLTISRSSTDFVGLFGLASSTSTISNLGLLGGSVAGASRVGALAGANGGSISNAYATGSVSGTNGFIGGLVGLNNGSIGNAYATGSVSGVGYVGGLVGWNYTGSISNAYATGRVSGADGFIGGLVGVNNDGISNAYATGSVSGDRNVGGLVGYNSGSIGTAYAIGSVSGVGTGSEVGGLVGYNDGSISNAHATGSVSGTNNVGGLVGYNTNTGSIANAYASGSVSGTGDRVGGLVGQNDGSISNVYATGNVSGDGDYVGGLVGGNWGSISTAYATGSVVGNVNDDTAVTGGLVGGNWGSISDAYASGSVSGAENLGGLVGYNVGSISDAYATGSVSGAGDKVGGLVGFNNSNGSISTAHATGNVSGSYYVGGLVGTSNGTISDAYATGSVSGDSYAGGLVGFNGGAASISNAYATGSVSGSYAAGGLVGVNNGSISSAYGIGSVSGDGYAGGLVGLNGGSISNAYATGSVSGSDAAGGLVGLNNGSISNAYATGSVLSGDGYVGGLVGVNGSGGISNTYATGNVAGSGSKTGGLVGHNDAAGTVAASFWLNSVSTTGVGLQDGSIDSLTRGLSASEARSASTYTAAGWDVATVGGSSSVWRSYDGSSMPLLRSFLTALTVTTGNTSKTYDGTAGASGSYTLSDSGANTSLILGTASYSNTSSQNVGSYSVGTSGLYSGQQGYDIRYVNGTANITRASLTVSANNASKTADGTAYSGGNGVNYSGFVNGESSSVLSGSLVYGGTAQGATAAGSYSLSASGLSAGNYALTYVDGVLVVSAAAATPITTPIATLTTTTDTTALTQAQQSQQATQPGNPFVAASATSPALDVQSCGVRLPDGMACH